MRNKFVIYATVWSVGLVVAAIGTGGRADPARRVPVLLELFTSEGCSDCPPADALLTRLAKSQPVPTANIIAIEEHVAYWNNPKHWVDPYSSTQFTNRQYDYSATFNDDSPYTPEMVVDGKAHFVGSDEGLATAAIVNAEANQMATVSLQLSGPVSGVVDAAISITNTPKVSEGDKIAVLLTVTEGGLVSHVSGGENRGVTLHHSSVGRSLEFLGYLTTDGANSFSTTIALPRQTSDHPLNAVVFLQDTTTKRVYGVDEKPL